MSQTGLRFIDGKLDKERAYWSQKLSSDTETAGFPLDFARHSSRGRKYQHLEIDLKGAVQEKLAGVTQGNNTLAFTLLLAAIKVCLHKYTGLDDIIVGTAIHEQYKEMASLNKALALRDTVIGEMTCAELLDNVKRTLSEAYSNQKFPFERIVELLEIKPQPNRAPLFDVVAILENINDRSNVEQLDSDVLFIFSISNDSLKCGVRYDAELFKSITIEIIGEHLKHVLKSILENPNSKVADLSLVSETRQSEFIYDFNAGFGAYTKSGTVHELFEYQAHNAPESLALQLADQRMTYRQLNERANRLGHYLRKRQIGRGSLVGIYLEHSFDAIVALLGVLKCGAAYVPLEPGHPVSRMLPILANANPAAILSQASLAGRLAEYEARAIRLDLEWQTISEESDESLAVDIEPDDLAYIIYTSGSTGEPKGVKIGHQSLSSYVCWARDVYLQGENLSFALYSSLAFDLTITSIFTPLIAGTTVIIYPSDGGGAALIEILEDNRVGVLKLTPSHLALIKDRDNSASQIKRFIVGGEALQTDLAQKVFESFGRKAEIFNEYGPTEATVGCMIHSFNPALDLRPAVPIGKPASNAQIYLLDSKLNPVAENQPGEIYISGDGLAKGYLNKDGVTAEKFIDNPFIPGTKMYRTGDLGRRLSEGILEYLGRVDEQVKFHGHRVELNELRLALNGHKQIRDSVVMMRKDRNGNDVLIAYYVSRQEIPVAELRAFLAENVIEEVIPNIYAHLRKLPLTLNGKINYKALPTLEEAREKLSRGFENPPTLTEEVLAGIWSTVLGIAQVGAQDNFFELGGHSLMATQVISRIHAAFQVDLPLRAIFEAPTVAALAERVDQSRMAATSANLPGIEKVSRQDFLLPSFAQQRLWFLDQLDPGTPAYNMPAGLRLKGKLSVPALQQSIGEIIRRHEVLRTTFSAVDGRPIQVIAPPETFKLQVVDLSFYSEAEREQEVKRLADEETKKGFDLEAGPLFRASLLRLGAQEHVLLYTMHHIVSDGWSLGLFSQELTMLYEALASANPSPLPALSIQYADYASWQQQCFQGEVLERQLSYWSEQLEGTPPLQLPTDRPRPVLQTFKGAVERSDFSSELLDGLKALGRQEGVTLFMTALAAFKSLLRSYSGQDDICVGSFIAGRNRPETERLIGFFINNLALRTDLSGNPTFRELLGRERETALNAYAHQDVPFEKLLEDLHIERDLSRTPLFQVMFVLDNAPAEAYGITDVTVSHLKSQITRSNFDLTLTMHEGRDGLSAFLRYNTDLFDSRTVSGMLSHFERLLEQVVASPDKRLSELSLLTEAERSKVLSDWGHEQRAPQPSKLIHELFEAQVLRSPGKVAVVSRDEQLTYAELNSRANLLARRLQKLGVGPESLVALMVERSADMIAAMLGILKSGAGYVPLDPQYPSQRLSMIIEDAAPSVIITGPQFLDRLSDAQAKVVLVGRESDELPEDAEVNLSTEVAPENVAYVIYTSGSTGKPKGVMVEHRSLAAYTDTAIERFNIDSNDRILQFASVSFDTACEEIYPCLATGATLVLRDEAMLDSTFDFISRCDESKITILDLPTAYWHQLVSDMTSEGYRVPRSLRLTIIGGERARPDSLLAWSQAVGDSVKLVNTYGPTETTVVATMCDLTAHTESSESGKEVPIGRATGGARVYLLDTDLSPSGIGVRGQVCIGGSGVARGYLNRPDLTAEKFIPDPFGIEPGARIYCSGDVARYHEDGLLEFIGRSDDQVKIRGFRVELGEIEEVIKAHPAVANAVMLLQETDGGDKRLIAYAEPKRGGNFTSDELFDFLKERVPSYMLPAAIILMDALPKTTSGKLDRRQLPAPGEMALESKEGFFAPSTPEEQLLAEIWEDFLKVHPIGIYDNFFRLGGHSLLATQVISRMRRVFQAEIPLRVIFESPTIAELALSVEEILIEEMEREDSFVDSADAVSSLASN